MEWWSGRGTVNCNCSVGLRVHPIPAILYARDCEAAARVAPRTAAMVALEWWLLHSCLYQHRFEKPPHVSFVYLSICNGTTCQRDDQSMRVCVCVCIVHVLLCFAFKIVIKTRPL